jgi:hypothetical protein
MNSTLMFLCSVFSLLKSTSEKEETFNVVEKRGKKNFVSGRSSSKRKKEIPFFRLYGPVISRILVILFYSFINNTLFLGSICRNGFVKKNVESLVRDFNNYVIPSAHPHLGVSDPYVGLYDVSWKYADLILHIVIFIGLVIGLVWKWSVIFPPLPYSPPSLKYIEGEKTKVYLLYKRLDNMLSRISDIEDSLPDSVTGMTAEQERARKELKYLYKEVRKCKVFCKKYEEYISDYYQERKNRVRMEERLVHKSEKTSSKQLKDRLHREEESIKLALEKAGPMPVFDDRVEELEKMFLDFTRCLDELNAFAASAICPIEWKGAHATSSSTMSTGPHDCVNVAVQAQLSSRSVTRQLKKRLKSSSCSTLDRASILSSLKKHPVGLEYIHLLAFILKINIAVLLTSKLLKRKVIFGRGMKTVFVKVEHRGVHEGELAHATAITNEKDMSEFATAKLASMAELMSLSWMLIGSNKKGIVPPLSVSSVPAADMEDDDDDDEDVGSNNLLPTGSTIPAKKGSSSRRNSSTTPKRSETGERDNMNKSPKNSILADKVADRTDRREVGAATERRSSRGSMLASRRNSAITENTSLVTMVTAITDDPPSSPSVIPPNLISTVASSTSGALFVPTSAVDASSTAAPIGSVFPFSSFSASLTSAFQVVTTADVSATPYNFPSSGTPTTSTPLLVPSQVLGTGFKTRSSGKINKFPILTNPSNASSTDDTNMGDASNVTKTPYSGKIYDCGICRKKKKGKGGEGAQCVIRDCKHLYMSERWVHKECTRLNLTVFDDNEFVYRCDGCVKEGRIASEEDIAESKTIYVPDEEEEEEEEINDDEEEFPEKSSKNNKKTAAAKAVSIAAIAVSSAASLSSSTSIFKAAALSAQRPTTTKTSTSQATSSSSSSPPGVKKEFEFKPKPPKEQVYSSILSARDKILLENEELVCFTDIAASRKRAEDLADSDATRQLQETRVQQGKVATLAEWALYFQRKAALLGYTGGGKRSTVQVERHVVVEKVDDVSSQMDVDDSVSTPDGCPINGMVSSGPTCFMGSGIQLLALIAASSSGLITSRLENTLDATNSVLKLILHILKVQTLTDISVQKLQDTLWKSFQDGTSEARAILGITVGPDMQMDITGPLTNWLCLFSDFLNEANSTSPKGNVQMLTTTQCSRCGDTRQISKVEPDIPFLTISLDRVETFQQMLSRHFKIDVADKDQYSYCQHCTDKITNFDKEQFTNAVHTARSNNKSILPQLYNVHENSDKWYQVADMIL